MSNLLAATVIACSGVLAATCGQLDGRVTNAVRPPEQVQALPAATRAGSGFNSDRAPRIPGWRTMWSDNFDQGPINDQVNWGRYGWGLQRPTGGSMGRYDINNVTISGGSLNLRYRYDYDAREWTSAGVSGAPSYSAGRGRWEFRARFPQGQGFGYAFLLWPVDEQWPPEVDILEGPVNGPQMSAFYHYGPPHQRLAIEAQAPDLTQWHTYGVIMSEHRLEFTLDGKLWGAMDAPEPVTTKQMWIGFQTGAIDPNAPEAQYFGGGVPGGVPGPTTPAIATIQIDWVAHYQPIVWTPR